MGIILVLPKRLKKIAGILFIVLATLEYAYFFNKYQPFAPAKFVFPSHPVFNFLRQNAGFNRFFGQERSYIDNNFATFYRVFSPEGYDPLYIRRYEEFLAGSTQNIPRSDAWINQKNESIENKSLDLLGVKDFVDITDSPTLDTGQNFAKFPGAQFGFAGQVSQWKFYDRHTALPRAFLADNYQILPENQILARLYSSDFDARNTLILEKEPAIKPAAGSSAAAEIIAYTPNEVTIQTNSDKPKLLFLSDNYYPGWKALVDGQEAPILRADYTFRAVSLPAGEHVVKFNYQPQGFYIGAFISVVSLLFLFGVIVFLLSHEKT